MVVLASCAQLGQRTKDGVNFDALPASWQNSGKIAIRVHARAPDVEPSNHVLRYNWQQSDDNYTIKMSGAFGFGAFVISRLGEQVTLSRGAQILAEANNSEQLSSFAHH